MSSSGGGSGLNFSFDGLTDAVNRLGNDNDFINGPREKAEKKVKNRLAQEEKARDKLINDKRMKEAQDDMNASNQAQAIRNSANSGSLLSNYSSSAFSPPKLGGGKDFLGL